MSTKKRNVSSLTAAEALHTAVLTRRCVDVAIVPNFGVIYQTINDYALAGLEEVTMTFIHPLTQPQRTKLEQAGYTLTALPGADKEFRYRISWSHPKDGTGTTDFSDDETT